MTPYTPSATEIGFIVAGGLAIAVMACLLLAVLVHDGRRALDGILRDFDAGRDRRRAIGVSREREGWRV